MLSRIRHLSSWLRPASPEPAFFRWGFGGRERASPLRAGSFDFSARFMPVLPRKAYSFREELRRSAQELDEARKGKVVSLCYSGGISSELLALTLAELGIPFDLYFLDLWGKNREPFGSAAPALERRIGKKVEVISLGREHFYEEHSLRVFGEFGCELPTYLALTYLFERIPGFLLVGEGGLHREGGLFRKIGESHPPGSPGLHLPFSYGHVFYSLWARKNRRAGEFYFFRRRPELVAAALLDPHFHPGFPFAEARELVYSAFPDLTRRPRSTNWEGHENENKWIRAWLANHAASDPALRAWRRSVGTAVRMDDLFLP